MSIDSVSTSNASTDDSGTIGTLLVSDDGSSATLKVPHGSAPFAIVPQLVRGVGSSAFRLDRGEPGGLRHVTWVRGGSALVLVELNKHQLDTGYGSAAAADSFARSALHRAPILGEDSEGLVVDVTELALTDLFDVHSRSMSPDWARTSVDRTRSWLRAEETRQHDAGIELTADLTLVGAAGAAGAVVTPDLRSVTVTQRLTLIPLPAEPMPARRYHPASGGYGKRFSDFSLPIEGVLESGWQPRFRLEATDPTLRPSPVRAPIVFTLDPEVPEPWASALIEGGNWWREGFERAGFADAYRVEAGAPGADLAGAGSNPVWWVHRDARGYSMGAALTDPRSGEILKGNVRLGSQRVQQLTQMGEALLTPYGRDDEARRLAKIEGMVLARLRQLAAHEIGHALGFMHNYASTLADHPSVMDYPHPVLALDGAGEIDIEHAYASGLSAWDVFTVRSAYEQFPDGREEPGLEELRAAIASEGHHFITDDDGHGPAASSTRGVPWIFGAEPIGALRAIMAVRAKALADFSRGAAPRGAQTGELESRYVIVHLLHRYHVLAVARLLGGVDYAYGDASDPATAPVVVPAASQHAALGELAALLHPTVTAVPAHVRAIIAPPSIRFSRGNGAVSGHLGPVFDPLAAAAIASAVVADLLFEPARLNRVCLQHGDDPASPGITDVVREAIAATLGAEGTGRALVAETTRAEVIRSIVRALRSGDLHAAAHTQLAVSAAAAGSLLGEGLGDQLQALVGDPSLPVPWPKPVIPVGVPI